MDEEEEDCTQSEILRRDIASWLLHSLRVVASNRDAWVK
jgi:hypothetical protein